MLVTKAIGNNPSITVWWKTVWMLGMHPALFWSMIVFFILCCCLCCCYFCCIFLCIVWDLWKSNARDYAAATSANDDFEYGESRIKGARRIERLNDKRIAINGLGCLPPGFDHVKIQKDAPVSEREINRYYFYTEKRMGDDDTTYVPFS